MCNKNLTIKLFSKIKTIHEINDEYIHLIRWWLAPLLNCFQRKNSKTGPFCFLFFIWSGIFTGESAQVQSRPIFLHFRFFHIFFNICLRLNENIFNACLLLYKSWFTLSSLSFSNSERSRDFSIFESLRWGEINETYASVKRKKWAWHFLSKNELIMLRLCCACYWAKSMRREWASIVQKSSFFSLLLAAVNLIFPSNVDQWLCYWAIPAASSVDKIIVFVNVKLHFSETVAKCIRMREKMKRTVR